MIRPPFKKIFKWSALALLLLGLVLLLGGLMIDPTVVLSTEVVLEAPQKEIYALISTPTGVQRWWKDAAKALKLEGKMPEMTVVLRDDKTLDFHSGGKVTETWTRLSLEPNRVVWEVDFKLFKITRTLTLSAPSENQTKVVWHDAGELHNPLMRWMKLMPQEHIIENFIQALSLLELRAKGK